MNDRAGLPLARGERLSMRASVGWITVYTGRPSVNGACRGRPATCRERRSSVVRCTPREDYGAEQRRRFYDAVVSSEEPLDLFEALLCIADGERAPEADLEFARQQMDRWCKELTQRTRAASRSPLAQLGVVNQFFFDTLGFHMVENDDFYEPSNSLLTEVIRRRVGIPISLCVVYRELCSRATSLRAEGVNFPAHFVLRVRSPTTLYIDPSNPKKTILRRPDLQRKLDVYFPDAGKKLQDDMLTTADERAIVVRVLRNLKTAYLKRNENEKALAAMDRLVLMMPTSASDRRDRGLLLHVMGRGAECVRDLEFYVALERSSADAVVLRALIQRYKQSESL